jgi:uncharacterized protein
VVNLYWPRADDLISASAKRRRLQRRIQTAELNARRVLLVSHQDCLDGAGSVIVTLRALGQTDVGVLTCQPSEVATVLRQLADAPARSRTLMIADLSLDPVQLDSILDSCKRLKQGGWRIEWRDHHHKQWEGIDEARLSEVLDVLEVNSDASESGASLQQQAVAPKDTFAKRLAEVIRDRDLWWNKTPDSETLEIAMNRMGEERFIRHFLGHRARDPVVDATIADAAEAERERIEQAARVLLSEVRYFETKSGDRVAVVYGWLPKNVGLHRVLEKDGVMVALNVRPNGNMSLRSRRGADVCQLVAREFGGGGHPNASGGTLGWSGPRFWWYVLRRGRVGKVRRIAASAVRHLEQLEG